MVTIIFLFLKFKMVIYFWGQSSTIKQEDIVRSSTEAWPRGLMDKASDFESED